MGGSTAFTPPRYTKMTTRFAQLIAVAQNITEAQRAEEERERLRARENEARTQKEERRRIAWDLHDVVPQDLVGVSNR